MQARWGNKRTWIETGVAIERQRWELDVVANVRGVSPWLEWQFTNDLDLPMTSTATPVSAAAEQEHYHNDNQDQFHGISPLMATAFFAAYLSIQRRLQNIVPNKRATRQLALRRVSNFAQSSARLKRARIRSMRSC
jgi:hypothetical protein